MFKFGLPFAVGNKCVAGMGLPLGLEGEHFAGIVENGCCGVFLGPCPLRVSKRAERRRFFSDANIARYQIRLLERDINLRFIRELDRKHFVFTDSLQPTKSSDAMLEMHDKVTFCQLTEIDLRAMAFDASQPPATVCGQPPE